MTKGLEQYDADDSDLTAVVGMSCRFPGADDLAAFWRLLVTGEQATGPGSGFRVGRRPGGYVDGVDLFDADFFGISNQEAADVDPQQRLLLELCWHALEDVRTEPRSLEGSRTGVIVGACSDEYALLRRADGRPPTPYTMTGTGRAFLANRISHFFGFTGPSVVVDTGQSSSLVALHEALRWLRSGECSTVLVAGVQLNLSAEGDATVEALGALSPNGRCYTFDTRANGIVRGEGAGVLVLKRLSAALADSDRIYCVVRGGVVNNDGAVGTLTTPDQNTQREMLIQACHQAGVVPTGVDYVELHGTGTAVGDPVEARALGSALGCGRSSERPLLVGSVKTNIGHLEGAAGIAGAIKTALSLYHREIPPSLNYVKPNPKIDLETLRLRVCDRLRPWPQGPGPRVAGVSSFGLGGTNCHMLLTEAPHPEEVKATPGSGASAIPVVVSGRTAKEMRQRAHDLAGMIGSGHGELRSSDIGLSAATTRTAFDERGAVVATSTRELVARLRILAQGENAERTPGIVCGARDGGRTAFLFPGQGMQRPEMGKRLYKEYGVFAAAFDEACAALEAALGASVVDAMWERTERVDRLNFAQPALFALEVALYRLFESWGLLPDFLLGHSQGEISIAHVAGVLSLEDAAVLVARRGQLIDGLPPGGAMVAVQAEEEEAAMVAACTPGVVGIAAVNSPRSLVVSGEEVAVTRVADHFADLGRRTRRLRIAAAGHSRLMAPIQDELRATAERLNWNAPSGPEIISTVTGKKARSEDLASPDYWARHLCATVRFGSALRTSHDLGARFFVELGPGQGLSTMAAETVDSGRERFAAPLATEDETGGVAEALGHAFVIGAPVSWRSVFDSRSRIVDLPLYPFQRRRHWFDAEDQQSRPDPQAHGPVWDGDPFELVVACTSEALELGPGEELDLERSFNDLGISSLQAVALRTRLARTTGRSLPSTLLFDHPTPASLIKAFESDTPSQPPRKGHPYT